MAYYIPSPETHEAVVRIVTAALIVRRDDKGGAAYISRRLGISRNEAEYISSVLEDLGLIEKCEDGKVLVSKVIKSSEKIDEDDQEDIAEDSDDDD